MGTSVRAIGLFSGGLDSILAVRLLQEQGIEVIGYTFVTPFFGPATALESVKSLDIRLEIVEITEPYMEILKNPEYGYGKNLNPCIDCHAFMYRRAGERMEAEEARFLFSGEVLGERPFSQNNKALKTVADLSGYADYILRPLSARLLKETSLERDGLVDRSRLLDIQGRSRSRQMELARRYGVTNYPTPGGGCRLTEPNFAKRLKDLLDHTPDPGTKDLELLKLGRQFRWDEEVKIVVGRNHGENERLESLCEPGDTRLWVKEIPGPVVVVPSCAQPPKDALLLAASLAVRYSDVPDGQTAQVEHTDGSVTGIVQATAGAEEEIREKMV